MNIFILCFQTKKNLIEKTQKQKNGDSLKSGQNRQKSAKIDHFTVGGPYVRKMRFLPIFGPISKGRRFFVSRPFLSIFFFVLKAQNKFFNFYFAESRISQFLMNLGYFTIGSHLCSRNVENCVKTCEKLKRSQKMRYAPFRKIKMKLFILCFQTKKKLIEKTQKPKNGDSLLSGQKSAKRAFRHF